MEKFLKKFFGAENKGFKSKLFTIFAVGVLLMASTIFFKHDEDTDKASDTKPVEYTSFSDDFIYNTERKIENILSSIEGAGEVKVMITVSYRNEIDVANELKKEQIEESKGANEIKKSLSEESKIVLIENRDGSQSPLVLRSYEPKIEGALIVAEGGGDIIVQESLIRAAEALLNIPVNKVQVLKMK